MPDLLVRDLSAALKRQLEERARKSGRSLSAEAKLLLQDALLPQPSAVEGNLWFRIRQQLPEDCRLEGDLVPHRDFGDRPPPNFDDLDFHDPD